MGWTRGVLALLFLVLMLPPWAGAVEPQWEATFDMQGYDEGRSIAATEDLLVVGGLSRGTADRYYVLAYDRNGSLKWEIDMEAELWDKDLRNVAVAIGSQAVVVACTDRSLFIRSFHPDGRLNWARSWTPEHSLTDLDTDAQGNIYVLGCSPGEGLATSVVLKYGAGGELLWNATLEGCGRGVAAGETTLYVAGSRGNQSLLYILDSRGNVTGNRTYGEGSLVGVAFTDHLYLLHTAGEQTSLVTCAVNGSVLWSKELSGRRQMHSLVADDRGNVYLAGALYNQTGRDYDFLVEGYLPDGSPLLQYQYDGTDSKDDGAWDVSTRGGLAATGYTVTKQTVPGPPPYVIFNRDVYTVQMGEGNVPPTASFAWDPPVPETGEEVLFMDRSTDPDGSLVSWFWDFGDGKMSTLRNPDHVYKEAGTYNVTLTVTDDGGLQRSLTRQIAVEKAEKGTPGFGAAVAVLALAVPLLRRRR
ncbi:MAG TPA: PKD domain-containing protein [Thermoplasmatales archaeon]|nr:PKD domain-containing protein [Thermoplasmatales archaeon]